MAKSRTKTRAQVAVPGSKQECMEQITRIGQLQRQHAVRKAELDEKIAKLTDEYAPILDGLATEIQTLTEGVQAWSAAHRAELTKDNKVKSANLLTGVVEWRNRPPSISIKDEKTAVLTLKQLKLGDYVRTVESVNKEALLALDASAEKITDEMLLGDTDQARAAARVRLHRELVAGISNIKFNKGIEDFSVTPLETEADVTG